MEEEKPKSKRSRIYSFIEKYIPEPDIKHSKMYDGDWISIYQDGDSIINYYRGKANSYIFKGEYPMMFIQHWNTNSFILHFVMAFNEENIPYIFDWMRDKFNLEIPDVKTYLYGDTDMLEYKFHGGIHGNL